MTSTKPLPSVRDLLVIRRGVVFVPAGGESRPEAQLQAVELELAELGYVLSQQLRTRLASCSLDELTTFLHQTRAALLEHTGGDRRHQPLFRKFPHGIPSNTAALWWQKVVCHFVQSENQPCLFCGHIGTTHVLKPCRHVVCDRCFDGANYSACPVCEHHVDRSSPFFLPTEPRPKANEQVVFKLLQLGESQEESARALLVSLCERNQALSPDDRQALVAIVREYQRQVLAWLPEKIPVRENVAIVFGTLFQELNPLEVLPQARKYLTTATDVLRLVAVQSGADAALQFEIRFVRVERLEDPGRFWQQLARLLRTKPPGPAVRSRLIPLRTRRFKVAKMSRAYRRALLELLEGLRADLLTEDMLRHNSYWVWLGEFLHPHEYSQRFPHVAEAFRVVRKQGPDGTPAPPFRTWYSRLESASQSGKLAELLAILNERPGEFARRLDMVLRRAGRDQQTTDEITRAFVGNLQTYATPVLLMLATHLSSRTAKAPIRVFWPKGDVAKGASSADRRPLLAPQTVEPVVAAINSELLRRFAAQPHLAAAVIDETLKVIPAPFNERTASPAAVALPRGSTIQANIAKTVRLFLHWCQPEKGGFTTDLDLSVGFYDTDWKYVGVCSFYQLQFLGAGGKLVAQSAGDLRDAPWPDGATEFVDIHSTAALAEGTRYVVMVVNNYAGMPFSQLERGFAGLMLRDDTGGAHFDPRTVELKFSILGENGIFLPLVVDLQEQRLHWLDVQSQGQFAMNTLASSQRSIAKLCPELITYFASGARPTMFRLALLHAAARCDRVYLRSDSGSVAEFVRQPGETSEAFLQRLLAHTSDASLPQLPQFGEEPLLAALYRGDLDLPERSSVYALFRERVTPTMSAADWLS